MYRSRGKKLCASLCMVVLKTRNNGGYYGVSYNYDATRKNN